MEGRFPRKKRKLTNFRATTKDLPDFIAFDTLDKAPV